MRYILLISFLLYTTPLFAEDIVAPEDKDWQVFMEDAQDNYSMKRRGDEAMRTLALRIDEVLKETEQDLDKTALNLLKQNQEAWEKQIRTKCSFLADTYRGGSHAELAFRFCVVGEQKARISDLRSMHQYRTSP